MVRNLRTLVAAVAVSTFAVGGAQAQSTTSQEPAAQSGSATQGSANETAARQALLQARESLAEVAKSPEAGQLQGQARTEVSEIITKFNSLLSAEKGWYDQYRAVMQNLHNVLGPVTSNEPAAGTSATGTSATGTSGTTSSTAATGEIPSALRSKLVDFRSKLMEFGRAAGAPDVSGGVTASSASPSEPTGTTGSETSGTAGTTGTTEAAGTSGSSSSQAQSGADPSSASTAAASETVEHHLDAIDDIIQEAMSGQPSTGAASGTTGTSGTAAAAGTSATANPPAGAVTIDRAKLDAIQSHLQRIREIARSKGVR